MGDGQPGARLPHGQAESVRPATQTGPGARDGAGQGTRARAGDRAAPGRAVHLRDSARLAAEHTPLNRTSVGEILTEEGFGRLLRHPDPQASTSPATVGRDTRLPRTKRIDFGSWPATTETGKAGLLLAVPDLVSLGLPELVRKAGYPGTRLVPAMSWLLSLLALKLTRTRRVSHVDDLLISDPAASLFAGLAVLPKKSATRTFAGIRSDGETLRGRHTEGRSTTGATTPPWRNTTCPPAPNAPASC